MSAPSASLQDTMAAIAVLVTIGAALCVKYWRTTLQALLIVAIAIAFFSVAVVIYGLAWLMSQIH
jgi:hypothetical protein